MTWILTSFYSSFYLRFWLLASVFEHWTLTIASLACNVYQLLTFCNSRWRGQFEKIWSHLTTCPPPQSTYPLPTPPPPNFQPTYPPPLVPTYPLPLVPTYPPPPRTYPPPLRTYPLTYLPPPPHPRTYPPPPWTEKILTLFMLYWFTIFVISSVFFRYSDFVQVRVEIILHDDSSRFRYSTGYFLCKIFAWQFWLFEWLLRPWLFAFRVI